MSGTNSLVTPKTSIFHKATSCKHSSITRAATTTLSIDSVSTKPTSATTLYHILGIKNTASSTEIKSAYRSLAKKFHPDTTHGDPSGREFLEIQNAYATLSDPIARANYDLSISKAARHHGLSVLCATRRWETDQCW